MKTILITILTLFCLTVAGQGFDKRVEQFLDTSKFYFFDTPEIPDYSEREYIELKFVKLAVKLWDEYKTECWNDSTIEGYEYTWNTEYYSNGDVSSYNHWKCYIVCFKYPDYDCQKSVYPQDFKSHYGFDYDTCDPIIYHREPTLDGFMEFIKKKYEF